jgi:hypothetical protein
MSWYVRISYSAGVAERAGGCAGERPSAHKHRAEQGAEALQRSRRLFALRSAGSMRKQLPCLELRGWRHARCGVAV